jgi:hypothetical protein
MLRQPLCNEKNIEWARNFRKEIEPFFERCICDHLDGDDKSRVRTAYGDNYARLHEIKRKYDPDKFFRLNNNIVP